MARYRWEEQLKCEVCGRSGAVRMSEEGGRSARMDDEGRIDHIPEGFLDAGGRRGFYCVDHPAAKVLRPH